MKKKKLKRIFKLLAQKYIDDTKNDGQLFCGCRREDCINHHTKECIKCLSNMLTEESKLNKELKTN